MSSGVSLRPTRGRRALTAGPEDVAGWLSMVAVSHGLELAGEDGQWQLTGRQLSVEVVLDAGRRGGVREVEIVPHLSFADEAEERSVKGVWREILADTLAFGERTGAVLRSGDGDMRLTEADLDAAAGLHRVDHQPKQVVEPDPRWAWSPVVGHPTPPEPMSAALVATDQARGLASDEAEVRTWLDELERRHHDRVSETDGGWRITTAGLLLTVDITAVRDGTRLVRLDLVAVPSYDRVDHELAARRIFRIFLDYLREFGREVGGVLVVGDPPREPDDDQLYEFVGMTRIARRRYLLPADVRARVDHAALTRDQAQELMDQWLADEPVRLAWLAEQCPAVALDRSPESLVPLWHCVRARMSWRTQDQAFDPDRVPVWVDPDDGMAAEQFGDDTLWLIDAVARYWAAVWCQATGDRWVLHRSRIRGDVAQNRPVLERYQGSPIRPVMVTAARSLDNDPKASDQRLRELLDMALGDLRK